VWVWVWVCVVTLDVVVDAVPVIEVGVTVCEAVLPVVLIVV
jgi:hypothetical protein